METVHNLLKRAVVIGCRAGSIHALTDTHTQTDRETAGLKMELCRVGDSGAILVLPDVLLIAFMHMV